MIKTVKDIDLKGKRVIMRVDFNVPMKDGVVQDDTRIQAALPTIKYILEQSPRSLVLMSHLGDPKKDVKKAKEKAEKAGKSFTAADEEAFINGKNKMKPVSEYLAKVLGKEVAFAEGCFGQKAVVDSLPEGGVLMLENTRFNGEETSKDTEEQKKLAKELATYGDVYVNDAFGTAHRAHASTATIAQFMDVKVGGFLMEKEVQYLEPMVTNPPKPMVAIIGGAKVSSKIAVLESLLKNASALIIGGGMAYTFLKAQGHSIGKSLVEDDFIDTAKSLLKAAEAGADVIDCAIACLSGGTSQPPTETMHYVLEEMGWQTGLDKHVLKEINDFFKPVRDSFIKSGMLNPIVMGTDPDALTYQVPGGMLSNLVAQLTAQNKLDRFQEVLEEVPRVRKDLGYPPLVTPSSQMVGVQATNNVLAGERYKMVSKEIKAYLRGEYGKAPGQVDENLRKQVLGDEQPVTCRFADLLEPGFEKYKAEIGDLARTEEDVLSYAAFPQVAEAFLERRKEREERAVKYTIEEI